MSELLAQQGWLLAGSLLVLGLLVGSFLNVVAYRLPLMLERQWRGECRELLEIQAPAEPEPALTLAQPNSHCPACKAPIKPWQNIPLVSYLVLRGRCGSCGATIPLRYPLVEAASGVLSMTLAWFFGVDLALAGALLFTWALIALTLIDLDTQLLPDNITLPLLWLGLVFNLNGVYTQLSSAVLGAVCGYLFLWSVYWLFKLTTGKEGMGYGDFKLLAALGAWMGWQMLPLLVLLSSLVGAVCGLLLMVVRRRGKDVPIPFGPYLALAGWISLLWGDLLLERYLGATGLN